MSHNSPYNILDWKLYQRKEGEDKDLRGLFIKSENILIGAFIQSYGTAHFLIGIIDLVSR